MAHDFERIIEGEPQAGAQFDRDRLFERLEAGLQGVGRMRPVGDLAALAPAIGGDRGLADADSLARSRTAAVLWRI